MLEAGKRGPLAIRMKPRKGVLKEDVRGPKRKNGFERSHSLRKRGKEGESLPEGGGFSAGQTRL